LELETLKKVKHGASLKESAPFIDLDNYCTEKILTQPWIEGVNIKYVKDNWDYSKRKETCEILVSDYLKQVFIDNFFQGDTNFSNFIFRDDSPIEINWIDFGNWCTLSKKTSQSLFVLIKEAINHSDSNYLGHFEQLGFDLQKLKYFENNFFLLASLLFEPFLSNRSYNFDDWKLEERMDNLLGENKWWFRSSGNSQFLEFIKSFHGIINIVKYLEVNINWQLLFLANEDQFNCELINKETKSYKNTIPTYNQIAKSLVIYILKNGIEHIKIELPSMSFMNLENLIPEEITVKLEESLIDIIKIKQDYLKHGLIPGEVFRLETVNQVDNVKTEFKVYLV
jgi:hypothetical protein